ncbi:MAG: hypothetical protein SR3Q1_12125 [Quinella sp. 3Q1]|nr:hypothetical protein [Quinella sp. 3Q1]
MKKFFLSIAAIFILLGASNVYAAENFAVEVLNLVNAERAKVGVAPLSLADDLQEFSGGNLLEKILQHVEDAS